MEKDKKEEDDWIRLESKSRPGRFYKFNKATGETKWLPLKREAEFKIDSPIKLSVNKISNTPAQDRLKRLQRNLKTNQTKTHSANTTHPATVLKSKTSKEQQNKLKDEPSTSSSTIFSQPSKKIPKTANLPNRNANSTKSFKSPKFQISNANSTKSFKSPTTANPKKVHISDSLKGISSTVVSNEPVMLETTAGISRSFNAPVTNEVLKNQQNPEGNNSKFNNLRSGIVKRIKEICKIPFNMSRKLPNNEDVKSPTLITTTKFKATRKLKSNKCLKTSAEKAIINQIRDEKVKSSENKMLTTPVKLGTPSYPRGSANSRLERLKQSLISQQREQYQSFINNNNSDQFSKFSNESNNNKSTMSLPNANSYNISSTANDTNDNEIEAMDWQPILKNDESTQKTGCEPTLVVEKSKKLRRTASKENQTMSDIIDTVNENLLRFSAEKRMEYNNNYKKWHRDFYYFVVDTNVLLRDLTFVEDLSKMKLCDTKGSMLYIPYSVLQELDKLKMRCGAQEGVKTLAVRAIKYLNSKFENNSTHLQAQSALDERHCLVDINSADDSIINCCLQAKEHVSNLILLTEDINLRNKAICNNIMVSTKSDLLAKRYDSSDKP